MSVKEIAKKINQKYGYPVLTSGTDILPEEEDFIEKLRRLTEVDYQ